MTAHARRAGRLVLAGRAAEFEREVPFGVFSNALEDHLKVVAPARLADLTPDERRQLPSVFPQLPAQPTDAGTPLLAMERYRLHRAVRALLKVVAAPAGLVLILDDLHWCDEGSAELLGHLLRNPPAAGVLLACAYRPRQLSSKLHHEIVAAAGRGFATLVDVGPLSHVELPAAPGDLDAVELLQAAAVDVLHAPPTAAAHWLGSALRLLPQQPQTSGQRLHLLNLRARALGITGHLAQSRDILTEVLRMVPVGTDHRVAVVTFLTMLEHLLGNHRQARALLAGELAALPDQHGTAAGTLRVAMVLTSVT